MRSIEYKESPVGVVECRLMLIVESSPSDVCVLGEWENVFLDEVEVGEVDHFVSEILEASGWKTRPAEDDECSSSTDCQCDDWMTDGPQIDLHAAGREETQIAFEVATTATPVPDLPAS